jgi:hypothetical protein
MPTEVLLSRLRCCYTDYTKALSVMLTKMGWRCSPHGLQRRIKRQSKHQLLAEKLHHIQLHLLMQRLAI